MYIRPIIAFAILIVLLLQLSPLPAGASVKTINVRDFGAIGNGTVDDAPAINRALAAGVKLGPGTTVIIPKGRYHLESQGGSGHVVISDADGLTVRGKPGAVFAAQNPDINILSFSHCTETKVQKLTLEQEKTYFTQGTIDAIAPDGKSCDVTIDRRYDEPDAPQIASLTTLRSFSYSDTTIYRQDRWWPTVKTRTRTGDHAWHFEIDGWALVPDMAHKPFILWDDKHACHGINFDHCSECLIEDVDYYGRGTNAGLFLYNCPGTITLRRYNIKPLPGSDALLSCSGGGQMIDCRGSLVFEDCWFDKVDDDGSDILTGYDRVLKQTDARTLQVQGHPNFLPGDHIAVVDWQTRADRQRAAIITATPNPNGSTTLVLDQDVTILRAGTGNDKDNTARSADCIDRITDYNLACSSVTYRRCRIQALRARGLNLKAQNCLIEDCLFYDCSMPAVSGGPEMWWGEGPAIHHFTVRNNRFVNCNTRCIDIAYFDGGPLCTARDNRDILIEGNSFIHWGAHDTIHRGFTPQCPIRISNADAVIIRNNTFEDPITPDKPVRVLIENSGLVSLVGNRNLAEGAVLRR